VRLGSTHRLDHRSLHAREPLRPGGCGRRIAAAADRSGVRQARSRFRSTAGNRNDGPHWVASGSTWRGGIVRPGFARSL